MDNQQAKIEEKELAWLGGFLDGEGSFCMIRGNRSRRKADGSPVGGFVPRVTVCNTDYSIRQIIVDIADTCGLPYYLYDNSKSPTRLSKNKPSWHFAAQGMKRLIPWLTLLIPYLKAKRPQAELLLEYALSRHEMSRKAPLTPRQREIVDIFRDPLSPQRLNAFKGSRKQFDSEWYSPTRRESVGVAQK